MDDTRRLWFQFYFNVAIDPAALVGFTMTCAREGEQWVGICVELGTSTYGRDPDQVAHELMELVLFDLNSLEADGERASFFEAHNIEILELPERLLHHLRGVRQPPPSPAMPVWLPQHVAAGAPAFA